MQYLFNPQKNLKLVIIIIPILEMRNLNQSLDNSMPNVTWLEVKRVTIPIRQSNSYIEYYIIYPKFHLLTKYDIGIL